MTKQSFHSVNTLFQIVMHCVSQRTQNPSHLTCRVATVKTICWGAIKTYLFLCHHWLNITRIHYKCIQILTLEEDSLPCCSLEDLELFKQEVQKWYFRLTSEIWKLVLAIIFVERNWEDMVEIIWHTQGTPMWNNINLNKDGLQHRKQIKAQLSCKLNGFNTQRPNKLSLYTKYRIQKCQMTNTNLYGLYYVPHETFLWIMKFLLTLCRWLVLFVITAYYKDITGDFIHSSEKT